MVLETSQWRLQEVIMTKGEVLCWTFPSMVGLNQRPLDLPAWKGPSAPQRPLGKA